MVICFSCRSFNTLRMVVVCSAVYPIQICCRTPVELFALILTKGRHGSGQMRLDIVYSQFGALKLPLTMEGGLAMRASFDRLKEENCFRIVNKITDVLSGASVIFRPLGSTEDELKFSHNLNLLKKPFRGEYRLLFIDGEYAKLRTRIRCTPAAEAVKNHDYVSVRIHSDSRAGRVLSLAFLKIARHTLQLLCWNLYTKIVNKVGNLLRENCWIYSVSSTKTMHLRGDYDVIQMFYAINYGPDIELIEWEARRLSFIRPLERLKQRWPLPSVTNSLQ
ncbi:unnamed protein product, partial [Mesorhabditis spiculigera]